MATASVLIVDDQKSVRESLQRWLEIYYSVTTVGSGEECLEVLTQERFDVLLLDQRLPRMTGLEVLRVVVGKYADLPVVIMTGFGSVDQAVEAIKLGAEDYLLKPVDLDTLKLRIDKILSFRALAEENVMLRKQLVDKFSFHNIVTGDPALREICVRIETMARSDAAVLISGESGTGKELVARAVHLGGNRAERPFVPVACGAVPDTLMESELFGHEKGSFTGAISRRIGKFEEAADGTVFLDEIGELSAMSQVKLLRVLQEREFQRVGGSKTLKLDARIVSATNRNLEEAIETGEFRRDLFFRINTVRIDLPPLRQRQGDVPLLARHFLEQFAKQYEKEKLQGISPEAIGVLQRYKWPGNVRELKGIIEQATILSQGEAITPAELPEHLTPAGRKKEEEDRDFHELMNEYGRSIILETLDRADGVKKDAAEKLGLSQRALSHYLKKFGIG